MPVTLIQRPLTVLFLVVLALSGFASSASAWNLSSGLTYQLAGSDNQDATGELRRRATLSLGPSLSVPFLPSHAISAYGGMSYSRVTRNNGQNTVTRDEITPYWSLSLTNDIFIANYSGNKSFSRNDTKNGYTGYSSWQSSLQSAWQEPLWPDLRLSYGVTNSNIGDSFFSEEPDAQSRNLNLTVDWDLLFANLYYNYRKDELEYLDSGSMADNDSHFAKFDTYQAFFDNRVAFSLSQQYQKDTRNFDGSSTFLFPLVGLTSFAASDPVLLPDPLPGGGWMDTEVNLVEYPELRDNVFVVPITGVVALPGERIHLAFSNFDPVSIQNQIDILRVTLDPLTSDQAAELLLEWALYLRDPLDSSSWKLENANILASYDSVSKQINIPINQAEDEIMVVTVNPTSGVPVRFTELQAFRANSSDLGTGSNHTLYKSNYGLSYRITETIRAALNLSLDQEEDNREGTTLEKDKTTISGGISWSPSILFTSSLNYSESLETKTATVDNLNKNYGLSVSSSPLSTLTLGFNATHSETLLDDVKTSSRNNYSLSARTQIYPDLRGVWSLGYSDSQLYTTDSDTINSTNMSSRVELNAQIRDNLFGDLTVLYSVSESDTTEKRQVTAVGLNLFYRPSELLSLRGQGKVSFAEITSNELTAGMHLSLIQTHKTRLFLASQHTRSSRNNKIYHNFSLNGNWDIRTNLALRGGGGYNIGDINSYSLRLDLSLNI